MVRSSVIASPITVPSSFERALNAVSRASRRECSIAAGTFPDAWPVVGGDCLAALLAGGLTLLGVDAPSVDARDSTRLENHHRLFGGGACILENLDLRGVAPGDYELVAAPLKLGGADAAPVRALLRSLARGAT